jgi:hypothetical protein
MANVALNRSILEALGKGAALATDGNITAYTAHDGFAYFKWPGTLTVDLEAAFALTCIRMLLWDGLGEPGSPRNPRIYLYRLLVSTDGQNWKVVYDTGIDGYNGWQVFAFPQPISARYIRIHGLWNIANRDFHIVQIEAYDDSTVPPLQVEAGLSRTIAGGTGDVEAGDGRVWSTDVSRVIGELETLVEKSKILNPEPFSALISQLRVQVVDIRNVERGMDGIRREIIGPVNKELRKIVVTGRWQLWIGLIALVASVVIAVW